MFVHLSYYTMHNNAYETLSLAINDLKERGYTEDFNLQPDHIICTSDDATYTAQAFEVEEYHRFEGDSNPADMSIVYAIKATDGRKGTLVSAYGTYSDPLSSDIIEKLKLVEG